MKFPRRKTRYVSKQAKHPTCVLKITHAFANARCVP
jgi:hypothetical protein